MDEVNLVDGSPAEGGEAADPDWFRPPTRRERWIAGALFLGFGGFFLAYSFVWRGSWFRWVILGLAVWSVGYALGHLKRLCDGGRGRPR